MLNLVVGCFLLMHEWIFYNSCGNLFFALVYLDHEKLGGQSIALIIISFYFLQF